MTPSTKSFLPVNFFKAILLWSTTLYIGNVIIWQCQPLFSSESALKPLMPHPDILTTIKMMAQPQWKQFGAIPCKCQPYTGNNVNKCQLYSISSTVSTQKKVYLAFFILGFPLNKFLSVKGWIFPCFFSMRWSYFTPKGGFYLTPFTNLCKRCQ